MFLKVQEEMRGGREAAVKILQHSVGIRRLSLHVRREEKRGFLCSGRGGRGGNHAGDVCWSWGFFFSCGETPMTHREMKTADVMRKKTEA